MAPLGIYDTGILLMEWIKKVNRFNEPVLILHKNK